ncbi:unnamed protein product [Ilex paraguariensis]
MMKIRAKYGLPLGYVSDNPDNQIALSKGGNKSAEVKEGLISCHRCLIYLGDLARYKGIYGEGDSKTRDFAAALSYYMQASSLWPSSGNPHHQLAILASYSGDELVAVYRYFRSLAVDNPFATARDNLIIAFEKNRQSYSQLFGDAKAASVKLAPVRMTEKGRGKGETRLPLKDNGVEASVVKAKISSIPETFKVFSIRFVRLNGILFTRTSLETFGEVFSLVKSDLLELLSSGPEEEYNFGSDAAECRVVIVRLIAVLIFTFHNVSRETENQSYAEILQRSVLLQNAIAAILEFMGHVLERCIQLNDPSASYLLPGIMVFVEWLACRQDIALGNELEEKQASARSFFWNHCISFFNKLLSSGLVVSDEDEDETCFSHMSRYDEGETANRLALPEDIELRGFLPLLPAQLILDFSRKHSFGSDGGNKETKARVQRVVAAAKALANVVQAGQRGIYFDTKAKRFMFGIEPRISDDYLLTSSLETPKLNGVGLETAVEGQKTPGVLQPEAETNLEGEEEDEVIVFKPSLNEKHVDKIASNLTSEFFASGVSSSKVDLGNEGGTFSTSRDGFLVQNAFNTGSRSPASVANITAQYLQPNQPSTSKWLLEQQGFITNGWGSLNLLENGLPLKHELESHLGVVQPATFSVPFLQSANVSAGYTHSIPVPETVVSLKVDSMMSSGAGVDNWSVNASSVMSAGLQKNPVSRPVRHFGPPPGFGSVPPKVVDGGLSGMALKNENPPKDDYSWLDGYQVRSSTQSIGFNSSINPSAQTYHPVSKSNSSIGIVGFPFPGKQVTENQRDCQHYQFPEDLKLYLEQHQHQQQPLQKGNQQSVALPQQHQAQSLLEDRFLV